MAEVTDRTALIVIDQITSATAREMPAGAVALAGNRLGVPVLVDAAHAPGLVASPLDGIDTDFWVGNLHKFACAPRGTAALVASDSFDQQLNPLIDSWGAPYPFPERFDHQGTVDVTGYLAARTSFDTIEQRYGWDAARAYMQCLGDYAETIVSSAMSEATGLDARVEVGMPVNALRLIRLPGLLATSREDAADLQQFLSVTAQVETSIMSWRGEGFLRLSTHVYNTPEDYEDFAERVVPIIVTLGRHARSGDKPLPWRPARRHEERYQRNQHHPPRENDATQDPEGSGDWTRRGPSPDRLQFRGHICGRHRHPEDGRVPDQPRSDADSQGVDHQLRKAEPKDQS
jgi:isopenicillin-N epimerase